MPSQLFAVENISDEEEEEEEEKGLIAKFPTLPDTSAAAPAHHHRPPPPSSLPARSLSSPMPHEVGTNSRATMLPMKGSEQVEGTRARAQRKKWASVTSSSFDFSGDEGGGTPAAFGKQSLQCHTCYWLISLRK